MKKVISVVIGMFFVFGTLFNVAACQQIDVKYNIEFVVDGKVVKTVGTDGEKISMPKDPAKAHYTFDGWFWDKNSDGKPFTLNSILDQPMKEENRFKVYARWTGVSVPVNYEAQGGEIFENSTTLEYGKKFVLAVPVSSDKTKAFAGWYEKANGKGTRLTDASGASLSVCDFSDDTTVYAYWAENVKYNVFYEYEGADFGNSEKSTLIYKGENYTLAVPSKKGYDFVGWYESAGGKGLCYADAEGKATSYSIGMIVSDITVYAHYKPKKYTVTFDDQNGNLTKKEIEYGGRLVSAGNCYRGGFDFMGWYDAPGGQGTRYIDENFECVRAFDAAEDITLYAYYRVQSEYDCLNYIQREDGTLRVDGFKGQNSNFVIVPEYYDGKKVTQVGGFAYAPSIRVIYLASTVEEVDSRAFFSEYTTIRKVYFARSASEGTTRIGMSTFGYGGYMKFYFPDYDEIDPYYEYLSQYYTIGKSDYRVEEIFDLSIPFS